MDDLSHEQAKVLGSSIRVVEAGPGSGKTRAVVARFLDRASRGTKGVALVSFTNAAINEVCSRTLTSAHLRQAPHFVGTIDTFLHRFIVTPAEASRLEGIPTYWPSWSELPEPIEMRLNSVPGAGIPLHKFRLDHGGDAILSESALTGQETAYLKEVEAAGQRDRLILNARARIRGLNSAGIYDSNSARVRAFSLLGGAGGEEVMARIGRRFGAVLLDEAQDCDSSELGIIRHVMSVSEVVVVADPDQAIFEFRGSKPSLFTDFRDEHDEPQIARLLTNYRSTSQICAAVTALRSASSATIKSSSSDTCPDVFILEGTPDEQREKFLLCIEKEGIDGANAMVLAHAANDARKVAGSAEATAQSRAKGDQLAVACSVLSNGPSDPAVRIEAIRQVERIILSVLEWPEDLARKSTLDKLEHIQMSKEWLRVSASKLVSSLAGEGNPEDFGKRARTELKKTLDFVSLPQHVLGHKIKKPKPETWERCERLGDIRAPLRYGTAHSAKGLEYEAVLVALPKKLRKVDDRTVLDDWEQNFNTEPRRVLYVAASRAERLLAFGAGPHSERIEQLLDKANVRTTRL